MDWEALKLLSALILAALALLVWSACLLVLPQAEGSLDGQSQEGSH